MSSDIRKRVGLIKLVFGEGSGKELLKTLEDEHCHRPLFNSDPLIMAGLVARSDLIQGIRNDLSMTDKDIKQIEKDQTDTDFNILD